MSVPLLDENGDQPIHRQVITIDTVLDKSAEGMAAASMKAIEKFAAPVEGLFELILVAFIGAVVDHAALAEGRELFKLARSHLMAAHDNDDAEVLLEYGRMCLTYVLGDRFHKTQLVVDAASQHLGLGRGHDDMNAVQIMYDFSYYFRANPTVTSHDSVQWLKTKVCLPPSLKKQRWETNAGAAVDALDTTTKRLKSFPLLCYYPHFLLLDQAPKFSKTSWQFQNICRTTRFILDPRARVHLVFIVALHQCYQQKVRPTGQLFWCFTMMISHILRPPRTTSISGEYARQETH